MNIAYRCAECGSTNILVKMWYNLETQGVITQVDFEDTQCWCNQCKKYRTFGWFDLEEILARNAINNTQEGE